MSYKIIGDSCTDITEEMKQEGLVRLVPLRLLIEEEEFVDERVNKERKIRVGVCNKI